MTLKECTVGSYFKRKPSVRAEIIYDNYETFPRLITVFEKNLKLMIMSEKACVRNAHRGELGVRIQEGKVSDPTQKQAMENLMVDNAIANGDFSDSYFKDFTAMQEIYDGYTEITVMYAEYELFKATINALQDEDKKFIVSYMNRSKSRGELAEEYGVTVDAVNQKLKRSKKWIKDIVLKNMAEYS